jgi:phenylalanyl-tRNA synthetase beta chain
MAGQDKDQAFELSNALSPDLRYYRLSLTPSLLDKIHPNIKSGFDRFALFEIGKVHDRKRLSNDEGVPIEDERTALVVAVDDKLASTGSAYYLAKKYLSTLVRDDLLLKPLNSDNAITNLCEPYQIGRSALVYVKSTGDFLGVVGEFRPAVTLQFKLPKYCAGFEIETASLTELINRPTTYHPIPKFPYVWQDITLNLNDKINFDQIYEFIAAKTEEMKPINSVFSLTPINIYKKNAESEEKRMSFRLKIASHEKTLITTEVNTLLDAVAAAAQERFGASRV